jgi:pimeloyl-ACP methyl ester carboxylesterase
MRVQKLCLINTSARADSPDKAIRRQALIDEVQCGQFDTIVEMLIKNFVYNTNVAADVRQMFYAEGKEAFIAQEKAMLQRQECLQILPTIGCPTLVLHATEDANFSLSEHQEIVSHIPAATLALIKDAGHMSPMEQPQQVAMQLHDFMYG